MRATPATRSVPVRYSPATIATRPPNPSTACLIRSIVGGDQHLRHRTTGRRLFVHMLDHGLPAKHDQGLSRKTRRPVSGRNHDHHGWGGLSHGRAPPKAAVPKESQCRPCRRPHQPHGWPESRHLWSTRQSKAQGPRSQSPYPPHR